MPDMKINHADFVEKLQSIETLDLLYNVVEAKAGRHIDILAEVPTDTVIEAEEAINKLIRLSKAIPD